MRFTVREIHVKAMLRARKGATAVEFAITAPVVFLLVFGAIEFARANALRHTMAIAVYEAARRGIVPGATAEDVRATVDSILATVGTQNATVTVTPNVIAAGTVAVTVAVLVPLDDNSWAVPKFCAGRTLSNSCTLQRELVDTVSVP